MGAGAVGGYVGGHIAGAVADVTLKDVLTLTEVADQIRRIMQATSLSLIVDVDHDYGNALNEGSAADSRSRE